MTSCGAYVMLDRSAGSLVWVHSKGMSCTAHKGEADLHICSNMVLVMLNVPDTCAGTARRPIL